ncbi:MAG: LLM class F420-dependent oxidoreductase [Ilumatobacteraceae bacterium]
MKFGLLNFTTDQSIRPDELAVAAEQAGFDLLLFPDHTHVPVDLRSAWPGGGELPESYARIFDPFIAMSWALSATTRLVVGTGVALVAQRDPIVTAKQIASIDLLSGGRTVVGVGAGWSREEAANHGIDPPRRWDVMRENVLAMREIWTNDIASFEGEHTRYAPLRSWPKPAQHPHPPILIGGNGPTVLDRVIEYGDAWYPSPAPGLPPMADRIRELERRSHDAGRSRPDVYAQVFGDDPGPSVVERYIEAGADVVLLGLPSADRDTVLAHVERHRALLDSMGLLTPRSEASG